jgi:hypothetical protein
MSPWPDHETAGSRSSRLLTRAEAAHRCGITPSTYSSWSRRGIVPSFIPGTNRIDVKALEVALDTASRLSPTIVSSAYDEWRRERRARASQRNP